MAGNVFFVSPVPPDGTGEAYPYHIAGNPLTFLNNSGFVDSGAVTPSGYKVYTRFAGKVPTLEIMQILDGTVDRFEPGVAWTKGTVTLAFAQQWLVDNPVADVFGAFKA